MFDFIRKDNNVYAPVKGKCIDITEVKDDVFSNKLLGDGIAIIPEDNVLRAPCSGKLTMVFDTLHAVGITTNDGLEILIHIGIDTVNEGGKGFEIIKKQNSRIRKGEPLLKFDLNALKEKYDMSIMMIITNHMKIIKESLDSEVDNSTAVMRKEG